MSVAMIAVSRYLTVKDVNILNNLTTRSLIIFGTWVYGFGLLTPTNLKVSTRLLFDIAILSENWFHITAFW